MTRNEEVKKLMLEEYKDLNKEITDIKICQRTYFWSTATIFGVLMAYGAQAKSNHFLMMCVPVLITSPMWCIYFLKATMITRYQGYLRILEIMIMDENSIYEYKGWYSSLKLFRDKQKEDEKSKGFCMRICGTRKQAWYGIQNIFKFKSPNQFHYLDWLGFGILQFSAVLFIVFSLGDKEALFIKVVFFLFSMFLIFISSIYTLNIIGEITGEDGDKSTTFRELIWKDLLEKK